MDFHGGDYVEALLERYSTHVLSALLAELQDLKLVEPLLSHTAASKGLAATHDKSAGFSVQGQSRFEQELQAASQSLMKGKGYVAHERLQHRHPIDKPISESVVLIVEDDPDQLALTELRVAMAGYKVWIAESARALQHTFATKGAPDALVLDVMLPDGDGFDILSKLRRHRLYGDLPIILLTAKTKPDDIATGLKLGADGYVTKPYSMVILADLLNQVLGHSSPQGAGCSTGSRGRAR
jgi:CheY-like chemotaxis protein